MFNTIITKTLLIRSSLSARYFVTTANIVSRQVCPIKVFQSIKNPQLFCIRNFARYAPDPSQSLKALYPELAAQWHPIKNGNLLPIHVHPHSDKVVWWKCPKGVDHEWCSPVRMRLSPSKKTVSCPFCSGRRVSTNNSLANYSQIVENWHPTLNKKHPEEISSSSHELVWIQCHDHPDHVYSKYANVLSRSCRSLAQSNSSKPFCLICRGKKVVPSSSLAATDPELLKEWHPTKNTILPTEITRKSNKKVWWKCPNGHEYESVIANKTNQKSGCPYCGKKYITYTKSLAALYPNIAREWHPTKNENLTPETVFAHSSRRVWWKCLEAGHEWCTSVNNRTNYNGNGSKCPLCFKNHRAITGRKNQKDNTIIPISPETQSDTNQAILSPVSIQTNTSINPNGLRPPSLSIPISTLLKPSVDTQNKEISSESTIKTVSKHTENQQHQINDTIQTKQDLKSISNVSVTEEQSINNKDVSKKKPKLTKAQTALNNEKKLKNEKKKKKKLMDDYIRDNIHPIEGSEHVINF